MSAVLQRETFETSRALEYFSVKELRQQIGFNEPYWPVAILRELIDNALDACESAGVLPEIAVTVEGDVITVTDNGPGIPPRTVERSLDYLVRVSNKAYYVSPTRGQMGNAWKCVWAAPFVATGAGRITVEAHGVKHDAEITLDRIAQQPQIGLEVSESDVKTGTVVRIEWFDSTRCLSEPDEDDPQKWTAMQLLGAFSAFNPHATFKLGGVKVGGVERTLSDWKKWTPDAPTSAHWYDAESFRDLIAAYIAKERDQSRTVREFVSEFRGLSSTIKQKEVTGKWSGRRLHEFVKDGDVDPDFVSELLERMQEASKAPPATALGKIGKDHFAQWLKKLHVAEDSVQYACTSGVDKGLPYVIEFAFGVKENDDAHRTLVSGLNWSPVIGSDPDPTLRYLIQQQRIDVHDPVALIFHAARPRFLFADRGKTRLAL